MIVAGILEAWMASVVNVERLPAEFSRSARRLYSWAGQTRSMSPTRASRSCLLGR